jgi:hypothetical protein
MSKAQINIKTGEMVVEIEGADQKAIFAERSKYEEVFGQKQCGACKSSDIRYVVRKVVSGKKTYEYYELHCQKCHARLAYGLHQEGGTLFPKRKDEQGNYLENNGWVKYNPAADKPE